MAAVTAVMVGGGNRARYAYAPYARSNPDDLRIVAIAEPDPQRRRIFASENGIHPAMEFDCADSLYEQGRLADMAIIATQDRDHYDNALRAMGLSQGGTMTAFVSALEPRIRAADIIAYVNPFHEFAVRRGNFCGSQMVPSLYRWFDTSDIASLAAPRPLLLEMGIYDSCFFFKDMVRSAREVAAAYEAAGCPQRLEYDIHPGPHAFSGARAFDFFERWL